jgi:hypothetical protein
MNTWDQPTVKVLTKALGQSPRETRSNFEALVYGALRFYSDSITVRACCDFTTALDADVRQSCPLLPPEDLFRLYREAVKACPPWADVLSAAHARVLAAKGGEGLGQFFTPEDAAQLCGKLAVSYMKRQRICATGPITIHEPTVGAGSLLLAQMEALGEDASRCVIDAWDIDPLCCAMTALQFVANAVEHGRIVASLVVREGNVLTLEHKVFWMGVRGLSQLMTEEAA